MLQSDEISPARLKTLKILTKSQELIPISYLGKWVKKRTPKSIKHVDGRRTMIFPIAFNEEITDKKKAGEIIEGAIKPLKLKYPAYKFDLKIESIEDEEMNKWAIKLIAVCIIGILLVLSLVLNNLSQPFVVGMAIPFGLVGVILALTAHQMPLSLMAIIGLLGVAGVAVNDSLIMVDTINKLGEKGKKVDRELIIQGCKSRFRAIFLTTITTLGGVFPMAYGLFGESGFTQPLAFSMGWGLLSATILTLFVIPVMYEVREDTFRLWSWVKGLFKRQKKVPIPANANA